MACDGSTVLYRWLQFHWWDRGYISAALCPYIILISLREISEDQSNTAVRPLLLKFISLISFQSCLSRIPDWKLELHSLIHFMWNLWKVKAWDQWPCLMIPVQETSFTTVFEDDADQFEFALNTSLSIPAIARICPNYLSHEISKCFF